MPREANAVRFPVDFMFLFVGADSHATCDYTIAKCSARDRAGMPSNQESSSRSGNRCWLRPDRDLPRRPHRVQTRARTRSPSVSRRKPTPSVSPNRIAVLIANRLRATGQFRGEILPGRDGRGREKPVSSGSFNKPKKTDVNYSTLSGLELLVSIKTLGFRDVLKDKKTGQQRLGRIIKHGPQRPRAARRGNGLPRALSVRRTRRPFLHPAGCV